MIKILILWAFLCLTACASREPYVYSCPKINLPDEPHYPYRDLKKGDSHDKVAKAYAATVYLQNQVIQSYKIAAAQ